MKGLCEQYRRTLTNVLRAVSTNDISIDHCFDSCVNQCYFVNKFEKSHYLINPEPRATRGFRAGSEASSLSRCNTSVAAGRGGGWEVQSGAGQALSGVGSPVGQSDPGAGPGRAPVELT